MDFSYDDEQKALRGSVRALLNRSYPDISSRRRVVATGPGYDLKTWQALADIGALGLPFPEDVGGVGAGPVEVGIVAQEIGRVLAPEPYVEAVVLAGGLVQRAGSERQRAELLGALSAGEALLASAHAEPGARWDTAAVAVAATEQTGGWRLCGVKEPVPGGARADHLVVSARVGAVTRLFLVRGEAGGVIRTAYSSHDGTRVARIEFHEAPAEPLGDLAADHGVSIRRAQALARIAYAHESVGAMETAVDTTVSYLKSRKQFGVTLSRFQALAFRAADMYVPLELTMSTVLWAAMVAAADGVDVETAAQRARLQAGRAGRHIGKDAIQLHGGIALTAEYGVGHIASRLEAIEHLLGDADWAVGQLAAGIYAHQIVDPLDMPATDDGSRR